MTDAATNQMQEVSCGSVPCVNAEQCVSPFALPLRLALVNWLKQHPGGPYLITTDGRTVTRDRAHDRFVSAVQKTKWSVLHGWRVLRHSFISNCAAKNIDQRIIDEWVGHQTEAMRRRYRHLFPNIQQAAIESVFGEVV